jgi:hypothetical protein
VYVGVRPTLALQHAQGFCTSFVPRLFETSCVISSSTSRDMDSIAALALAALKDILRLSTSQQQQGENLYWIPFLKRFK